MLFTCEPYPLDVDDVILGVPVICLLTLFAVFFRKFFATVLTLALVKLFIVWKLLPMSRNDPIVFDVGNLERNGGFMTKLSS